MKAVSVSLIALLLGAGAALAQPVPFDMTPERPAGEEAAPPAAAPERPAPPAPALVRRLLLPEGNMVLSGETAAGRWALHLTQAEAAAPARLNLAYRNSVMVAPESSRLTVLVNGVTVLDAPVSSSAAMSELGADVPEGVLRAGRNEIALGARHRHRTDCTVESTYELWSEIDTGRTYLAFADRAAGAFTGVEDLRALPAGPDGRTHIEIVAPGMASGDLGPDILRLAQAIALHANLPDPDFSVAAVPVRDDAALRVLLGSAEELAGIADLPAGAGGGPFAAFLAGEGDGPPVLAVTGRGREDRLSAIGRILGPVDRPMGGQREVLATGTWRTPDAPMIYGERSLSFSELGLSSEQFSGRRYTAGFQFAVPADFYAGAYGQARILLDAAYSEAVLPGSTLNIHVNGTVAASAPLEARGGAVLDRFPVAVTMRHFRPGLNEVTVEAALLTDQDAACLPGATADDTPRFAVFDSSRFDVPDFARIGQRPDLAALAGTAFPYGLAGEPVAVVLERGDPAGLSAAATLLARMAISAGRAIPVEFTASPDAARGRDAIFLGPAGGIPAGVLAQVGLAEESRGTWAASHGRLPPAGGTGRVDAEEWRRQMDGQGLRRLIRGVEDWFSRTFDITIDMLRFAPAASEPFMPSGEVTIVAAQGLNPAGNGVWTVIAAPDEAMLREGVAALAARQNWREMSGRLATLGNDLRTVTSLPAASSFVATQPGSLANYRLIAANWLSANILSYSLLLVAAGLLLGGATSVLLSRLGRRS